MSTQSQTSVGEYYRLTLLDEAVVLYHTQKQDFIALQDYYMNCPRDEERYCYSAPNCLIMAEVLEDDDGRYWKVAYAAGKIEEFFKVAPFRLDRVCFCRYHKMNNPNPDKFYSWDTLQRISKHGQQTKTTTSASRSTSSSSASRSSSAETTQAGS